MAPNKEVRLDPHSAERLAANALRQIRMIIDDNLESVNQQHENNKNVGLLKYLLVSYYDYYALC